MNIKATSIALSVVISLSLLGGAAPNAYAATSVVTNLNDSGAGSLRQCLTTVANGDTIDATGVSGTILLTSGELLVTKSVTILGSSPASLAINGNAAAGVLRIGPGNTVKLVGLTITNGANSGSYPWGYGGGIYNGGSTLTLSNCAVTGNYAQEAGGGIDNEGTLLIVNSTISGNSVNDPSSIIPSGGGILNEGSLVISNSTISGNSALETGGGLMNQGSALIVNSTFSGNSAGSYGDGICNFSSLTLGSTILNTSSIRNEGGITSLGYNLSSDNGGGSLTSATDILNTNPQLGPLQNNGGPTWTHLPSCGGAAIGAGYNFSGSAIDQRGFPRLAVGSTTNAIGGDGSDIGAVEVTLMAQVYTVLNTNDSGPGSLRQAILDSNLKPCAASDTIQFDPGVTGKIKLTSGELVIMHSLAINGPGANVLALEGSGSSRVIRIGGNSVVTIAGLTITNGVASGNSGGGILNQSSAVTVRDCVISGNSAATGGGIYNQTGSLSVSNCIVRGNSVTSIGGGIFSTGGNVGNSAMLTLLNSTVSGNSANNLGGGLFNGGDMGGNGQANIRQCTFSGNTAGATAQAGGGAICSRAAGSPAGGIANLTVLNSTFSGNSAGGGGGGIYGLAGAGSSSVIQIGSTLLNAGAAGANLISSNATFVSLGFNLSSDAAGAFLNQPTDQASTATLVGPLQNNGGPSFTHALPCSSPAINRGKNFSGFASDQRGLPRTFGSAAVAGGDGTDIGAFESQSDCTIVTTTNNSGDGSLRTALAAAGDGDTINATGVTGVLNGGLSVTKSVIIRGPGAGLLAVNGNGVNVGFVIDAGKTVTIADLTITNCDGGGIYNSQSTLTVSNCAINGNYRVGIVNEGSEPGNSATLTILNSTISGNIAQAGGGVLNRGVDGGNAVVMIRNSTFSSNAAYYGGAIMNDGEFGGGNATVTIFNSTFSGNTAEFSAGAIRNAGDNSGNAALIIRNCTFNNNSSPTNDSIPLPDGFGGTIENSAVDGSATLDIGSTILKAGATGTNFVNNSGTVISRGYNLSSDNASAFLNQPSDINNVDPLLGPLQNNGGPTFTHALLYGSPALDKGTNFSGSVTDQRNGSFTRTVNQFCAPNGDGTDIGAFELPVLCTGVTNTADCGPGSLRVALNCASDGDTIDLTSLTGTIALTTGPLVVNKNITLLGPGANVLAVNGGGSSRVFYIGPSNTVTIAGLTIANGSSFQGGGIYNDHSILTVSNCTISGNAASSFGGGIYNIGIDNGGTALTLWNSTVSGNSASYGGGFYNVASSGGTATLSVLNSTVSGNVATNTGGGILNSADTSGSATLTIRNSTLSDNKANSGGGINNAVFSATATVQISGTILKRGATGANIVNSGGTIVSQGYNLSSDSGGGFLAATGDQINTDALLGPLQNNGGTTATHALSSGSSAINAGDPGFTPPPAFDQRGTGFPRVAGGRIDIGAFEFTVAAPPPLIDGVERIGDDLRLTFSGSLSGKTYEIQTRTNLTLGEWISLPGSVPGNGGTLQCTVTNTLKLPEQFFRIRQVP